jgi:hypothetical protein
MMAGRQATFVTTTAINVQAMAVHQGVLSATVMIVGDGVTGAVVNGSHVVIRVTVAEDTNFAGTASVLPVLTSVAA